MFFVGKKAPIKTRGPIWVLWYLLSYMLVGCFFNHCEIGHLEGFSANCIQFQNFAVKLAIFE